MFTGIALLQLLRLPRTCKEAANTFLPDEDATKSEDILAGEGKVFVAFPHTIWKFSKAHIGRTADWG